MEKSIIPSNEFIGKKFGRLTAISVAPSTERGLYLFRCDCGNIRMCLRSRVVARHIKSCGKHKHEKNKRTSNRIHGTPEYYAWKSMHRRCKDKNMKDFQHWGGRGIVVCERWKDFHAFYADMGPRPKDKNSLDRINNDGNYEPSNCRWATFKEQHNNRSNNIRIEHEGSMLTISTLAEKLGVTYLTIYQEVTARNRRGVL